MDAAIESSINLNTLAPFNQWNKYTQDVDKPIFYIDVEEQPSYMSVLMQEELDQAIAELDDNSTQLQNKTDIEYLKLATDPFYAGLKKRSPIKFTREYYDLLTLDSQLDLIAQKSVVLTFDPKYLQYLYEKDCYTILILLEGNGAEDKSQNNQDEKYYDSLSGISSQPDRIERISFLKEIAKNKTANLHQRWILFDKLSDDKFLKTIKSNARPEAKLPADIIIHVEETFGRLVDSEGDGLYLDRENPIYDKTFFDPCIKGLAYLKDGGKFILKASSFSSKLLTDICYLYKYLFRTICISKLVTIDSISQEYYIVAIGFNLQKYQTIKLELDKLLIEIDKAARDDENFVLRSFVKNTSIKGKVIGKQYNFGLDEEKIIANFHQSDSIRPVTQQPFILQQAVPIQSISSISSISARPISNLNVYIPQSLPQTTNQLVLQPKDEEGEELDDEADLYDVAEVDLSKQEQNYKSINFVEWIYDINDKMALWTYMNIKALSRTMKERKTGFNDGRPFFIYDWVAYRKSLRLLGSTTLKAIPSFVVTDEIVENLPPEIKISFDKTVVGIDDLGPNFILYLTLLDFIDTISSLEYTLPAIKSMYGNEMVTSATRYRIKQERGFYIREWLGILYALGYLKQLLTYTEPQIIEFLLNKDDLNKQYLLDIIRSSPKTIYNDIAKAFVTVSKNKISKQVLEKIKSSIIITPLDNLRYRIGFSHNGKKYAIMYRTNSSVIGDFEIMNMLTSNEKLQIDEVFKLFNLLSDIDFRARIVEHSCLPILFSGLPSITAVANETAVPQLYLKYKPEVEAFASAPNRYAPIWCSANEEDSKLGSSGNFFGSFSRVDNPLFDNIRLMIAFPPTNDIIFQETIVRSCNIIKHRKEQQGRKFNLAIIIVYWNTATNANIVAEKTFTCGIDADEIIDIRMTYNPFTGIENYDAKLKALVIKTTHSTFHL